MGKSHRVKLLENNFYEKDYLIEDYDLVAGSIDKIEVDFKYLFGASDYFTGKFNRKIKANIIAYQTGVWWTISPSYYDSGSNMKTVNVFSIKSDGTLSDWPDANLVAKTRYIRPVITLNIERLSGGNGSSADPYTFS